MGENSVLPVHRGEIQSAHLGCAIECWDEEGKRECAQTRDCCHKNYITSMMVFAF